MKIKIIISILYVSLFFNLNAVAKTFYIGEEINNSFNFNRHIKIDINTGNWEVVRAETLNWGVLQRIVGIGRVQNNEIIEIIEVYEGLLGGYYSGYVDPMITEIVFKDKHDGCYERPEYFLLELYHKGNTHNCMIIRHFDVTKELNYPDSPNGKAAASAYNHWIKKNSLQHPKIMLESNHSYFSRLTGGRWYQVRRFMSPKIFNAPQSKYFTETTSEYHKSNISNYPEHQKIMNNWISLSSLFHKDFEIMSSSKKNHKLNLSKYITDSNNYNSNDGVTNQLQKLNELYKSGALSKEEFTKAKKKILD